MTLSRSGRACDGDIVRLVHKSELNIVALDGFRQLFPEERAIPYYHIIESGRTHRHPKGFVQTILREDNLLLSLVYPLDKRIILVAAGLVQVSMLPSTGHTSRCEEQ